MKTSIIVDIDGTISKVGERLKYLQQEPKDWDSFYNDCFEDEPIPEIIGLVEDLFKSGNNIIFCTGRRESCRIKTILWLEKYFSLSFLQNYLLYMRGNEDHRHDTEVKPELLNLSGLSFDSIAFVIEDRNSMVAKWRELGLICLQPFDGSF